jgi:uncharacterized protein YcgI (DUF1989 family)
VELAEGESISVVDPEGGQVADLVVFDPTDETVRLSTKYTMSRTGRLRLTTGDSLYSTTGESMLSIVADDCGVHDMLFAPCNHWLLEDLPGSGGHGCRENLSAALADWEVPEHLVQDPLNVFMRATVTDHTHVDVREPVSEAGDTVTFRAETDAVVGVSACAAESTVNAGSAGPIDLRIPDSADPATNFEATESA